MTDERPGGRERVFNLPGAIVAMVALFLAIHAVRVYALTGEQEAWVYRTFAYVAGRMTFTFDPDAVAAALTGLVEDGSGRLEIARYLLGDGKMQAWTLLSYGFLHADWMHVTLNCLWLVVFGAPVARRFGSVRVWLVFLVGTALGALTHQALNPVEFVPLVGASAGVSAAMGAACRFVFQPGAPLGPPGAMIFDEAASFRVPAAPLAACLRDRRVLQFVLAWLAVNFGVALLAGPLGITDNGIAWDAHIGGFLAGFLLFPLFDPVRSKAR